MDMIATDPPYNPQLKITMSGGALALEHANRRTDYAMVTDDPADLVDLTKEKFGVALKTDLPGEAMREVGTDIDLDGLVATLREISGRVDAVVVTGGLGVDEDDPKAA